MDILKYNYLKQKHLNGIDRYKYVSVDTSPLSYYITNPLWDKTVEFFPRWIAPNLMTFIGFLLTVVNIILLTIYDYHFYASTDMFPSKYPPIPRWIWLVCAVNQFLSYALDSCDGKQARRTKTSSPLGELFDHGLDSWASIVVPLCCYSLFGRAVSGLAPMRVFFVMWGVLFVFLVAHWEKYITGIFYLPWAYDATQIALSFVFLVSFFRGYEYWHFTFRLFDLTINPGVLVETAVYVSAFGLTLPVALYHIYKHYHDSADNERRLDIYQALKPLVPVLYLFLASLTWVLLSPNDIITVEPRLFFFLLGTVYSNIVSKIVIAQMSGTSAKQSNFLLYPYIITVAAIIMFKWVTTPYSEILVLKILLLFSFLTHLHFGYRIVSQLSSYLGIYCFTITKKPSSKSNSDFSVLKSK